MTKRRYRCSVLQGGVEVATVDAPTLAAAHVEILRYAMQYVQDGPISIKGAGMEKLFKHLQRQGISPAGVEQAGETK